MMDIIINKYLIGPFKSFIMSGVLLMFLFSNGVCAITVLKIASIGTSSDIREALYDLTAQFQKINPDVRIEIILDSDSHLKNELTTLLKQQNMVDIVMWHAGERLNKLIEQDLVLPINDLWFDNELNHQFTSTNQNIVMLNGQVWAIPISYYQWGFYYKKSLFKRLSINPPDNWSEFVNALSIIKQQNITPIYIGSKNLWEIGIWFEYLNLRLNGLDFHNLFVQGEITAHSDGIKDVLTYWAKLIEKGGFFEKHEGKDLTDSFPYIYREIAAITLSGYMIEPYMDEKILNDIGFFPFPKIKEDVANIQVTPVDVMFIAKSSAKQEWARKFILFASNANTQTTLNTKLNQFPVNKHSTVRDSKLLQQMLNSLNQAEGRTYFYDREVEKEYGQENLKIWKQFLINPDIEKTVIKMEQVRKHYLTKVKQ
jgi:multiple sugar transport system substrate-binding protein